MDVFNFIAGLCSIASLLISIFVAANITKLVKINGNHNTNMIAEGDGATQVSTRVTGGDRTVSVAGNVSGDVNIGGQEKEPPVLSQAVYPIPISGPDGTILNSLCFRENIDESSCKMLAGESENSIILEADFSGVQPMPVSSQWIGFAVKSLPMNDWRSFVKKAYKLRFQYRMAGNLNNVHLEFKNEDPPTKPHNIVIPFESPAEEENGQHEINGNRNINGKNTSDGWKQFSLDMGQHKGIDQWKSISEIAFVFFPQECIGQKGNIYIRRLELTKE